MDMISNQEQIAKGWVLIVGGLFGIIITLPGMEWDSTNGLEYILLIIYLVLIYAGIYWVKKMKNEKQEHTDGRD